MVTMYRQGELLGSLYTGHWHEAIAVGTAAALRPSDVLAPLHRDLGAPVAGPGALAGHGQLHGQGHLPDRRPGRHSALRPARPQHHQPGQPHSQQLPGRYRGGVRAEVPRYRRSGHGVPRGRRDQPRGLSRGPQPGRGAAPAVRVHRGEQPVRLLHPARAHDRGLGLRQQGGRLRDARGAGGRRRRVRRARGRGQRGRPGPGRGRPIPHRGGHDAHARPRRTRPGRLCAQGTRRDVGETRPHGRVRRPPDRAGPPRRGRRRGGPGARSAPGCGPGPRTRRASRPISRTSPA
jgi:hypothetical protein